VSEGAINMFTLFFGLPSKSLVIFSVIAVFLFAICLMMLIKKAMKDKSTNKNFDEGDVLAVVLRGLLMLLIFTAMFSL
jgi:hypothetical protein